jgi:hypothetical protein
MGFIEHESNRPIWRTVQPVLQPGVLSQIRPEAFLHPTKNGAAEIQLGALVNEEFDGLNYSILAKQTPYSPFDLMIMVTDKDALIHSVDDMSVSQLQHLFLMTTRLSQMILNYATMHNFLPGECQISFQYDELLPEMDELNLHARRIQTLPGFHAHVTWNPKNFKTEFEPGDAPKSDHFAQFVQTLSQSDNFSQELFNNIVMLKTAQSHTQFTVDAVFQGDLAYDQIVKDVKQLHKNMMHVISKLMRNINPLQYSREKLFYELESKETQLFHIELFLEEYAPDLMRKITTRNALMQIAKNLIDEITDIALNDSTNPELVLPRVAYTMAFTRAVNSQQMLLEVVPWALNDGNVLTIKGIERVYDPNLDPTEFVVNYLELCDHVSKFWDNYKHYEIPNF